MPKVVISGLDIFVVFEYMKRIPAAYMILNGIKSGLIEKDTTIIETSSGTLAIGLSKVCGLLGLNCHIVSDAAIRSIPEFFCNLQNSNIHVVTTSDSVVNYQY